MSEKAQPVLSVRDLATFFALDEGSLRAVDGVSFDLYAGKTLGVVGESGCGKSITARCIMRMVQRLGYLPGGEILLRDADRPGYQDLTRLDPDGREMRSIQSAAATSGWSSRSR